MPQCDCGVNVVSLWCHCGVNVCHCGVNVQATQGRPQLGLWLRLECSLDSLSIVSTDHQIDRGLSVSLRLYEMCHVLVIV